MSKEPHDGSILCYDCGNIGEYYMVRDEVWALAVPLYREWQATLRARYNIPEHKHDNRLCINLCFECLEIRLERPLALTDFDLDIPVNWTIAWGARMGREETLACFQQKTGVSLERLRLLVDPTPSPAAGDGTDSSTGTTST